MLDDDLELPRLRQVWPHSAVAGLSAGLTRRAQIFGKPSQWLLQPVSPFCLCPALQSWGQGPSSLGSGFGSHPIKTEHRRFGALS